MNPMFLAWGLLFQWLKAAIAIFFSHPKLITFSSFCLLSDQSYQKGFSVYQTKKQKIIFVIVAIFLGIIFYIDRYLDQTHTNFFNYLKYKFEDVKTSELQQYPSYGSLIIMSNDKLWANQTSDLTQNVEVIFWYEKASLINGVHSIGVIDIPFKSSHKTKFSIPIPELAGYELINISIGELTIKFHNDSRGTYPFNHPNTIGTFYYYYTDKYSTEEEKKQNCWAGYDCRYKRLMTELTIQINLESSKKISSSEKFDMYDRSSMSHAATY